MKNNNFEMYLLGEWGFPIVGKMPPNDVPLRDYFQQLKKKHGKIFS